ncbi:hypothetical protein M8818_007776 [Zalaria obscura]|uniref:Uncharacterized protein n=1 Tax=Zalaria obscura TaxID=2024903 RepID=A0ACC3S3I8_9PEZI
MSHADSIGTAVPVRPPALGCQMSQPESCQQSFITSISPSLSRVQRGEALPYHVAPVFWKGDFDAPIRALGAVVTFIGKGKALQAG